MKVGDSARLSRRFSAREVAAYASLCGALEGSVVPEPLIGALWSCLLGTQLPGVGTVYLQQDSRFREMARIDETLTAEVEITRIRPEKKLADLQTTCRNAKGALIAEGRALVYIGGLADRED